MTGPALTASHETTRTMKRDDHDTEPTSASAALGSARCDQVGGEDAPHPGRLMQPAWTRPSSPQLGSPHARPASGEASVASVASPDCCERPSETVVIEGWAPTERGGAPDGGGHGALPTVGAPPLEPDEPGDREMRPAAVTTRTARSRGAPPRASLSAFDPDGPQPEPDRSTRRGGDVEVSADAAEVPLARPPDPNRRPDRQPDTHATGAMAPQRASSGTPDREPNVETDPPQAPQTEGQPPNVRASDGLFAPETARVARVDDEPPPEIRPSDGDGELNVGDAHPAPELKSRQGAATQAGGGGRAGDAAKASRRQVDGPEVNDELQGLPCGGLPRDPDDATTPEIRPSDPGRRSDGTAPPEADETAGRSLRDPPLRAAPPDRPAVVGTDDQAKDGPPPSGVPSEPPAPDASDGPNMPAVPPDWQTSGADGPASARHANAPPDQSDGDGPDVPETEFEATDPSLEAAPPDPRASDEPGGQDVEPVGADAPPSEVAPPGARTPGGPASRHAMGPKGNAPPIESAPPDPRASDGPGTPAVDDDRGSGPPLEDAVPDAGLRAGADVLPAQPGAADGPHLCTAPPDPDEAAASVSQHGASEVPLLDGAARSARTSREPDSLASRRAESEGRSLRAPPPDPRRSDGPALPVLDRHGPDLARLEGAPRDARAPDGPGLSAPVPPHISTRAGPPPHPHASDDVRLRAAPPDPRAGADPSPHDLEHEASHGPSVELAPCEPWNSDGLQQADPPDPRASDGHAVPDSDYRTSDGLRPPDTDDAPWLETAALDTRPSHGPRLSDPEHDDPPDPRASDGPQSPGAERDALEDPPDPRASDGALPEPKHDPGDAPPVEAAPPDLRASDGPGPSDPADDAGYDPRVEAAPPDLRASDGLGLDGGRHDAEDDPPLEAAPPDPRASDGPVLPDRAGEDEPPLEAAPPDSGTAHGSGLPDGELGAMDAPPPPDDRAVDEPRPPDIALAALDTSGLEGGPPDPRRVTTARHGGDDAPRFEVASFGLRALHPSGAAFAADDASLEDAPPDPRASDGLHSEPGTAESPRLARDPSDLRVPDPPEVSLEDVLPDGERAATEGPPLQPAPPDPRASDGRDRLAPERDDALSVPAARSGPRAADGSPAPDGEIDGSDPSQIEAAPPDLRASDGPESARPESSVVRASSTWPAPPDPRASDGLEAPDGQVAEGPPPLAIAPDPRSSDGPPLWRDPPDTRASDGSDPGDVPHCASDGPELRASDGPDARCSAKEAPPRHPVHRPDGGSAPETARRAAGTGTRHGPPKRPPPQVIPYGRQVPDGTDAPDAEAHDSGGPPLRAAPPDLRPSDGLSDEGRAPDERPPPEAPVPVRVPDGPNTSDPGDRPRFEASGTSGPVAPDEGLEDAAPPERNVSPRTPSAAESAALRRSDAAGGTDHTGSARAAPAPAPTPGSRDGPVEATPVEVMARPVVTTPEVRPSDGQIRPGRGVDDPWLAPPTPEVRVVNMPDARVLDAPPDPGVVPEDELHLTGEMPSKAGTRPEPDPPDPRSPGMPAASAGALTPEIRLASATTASSRDVDRHASDGPAAISREVGEPAPPDRQASAADDGGAPGGGSRDRLGGLDGATPELRPPADREPDGPIPSAAPELRLSDGRRDQPREPDTSAHDGLRSAPPDRPDTAPPGHQASDGPPVPDGPRVDPDPPDRLHEAPTEHGASEGPPDSRGHTRDLVPPDGIDAQPPDPAASDGLGATTPKLRPSDGSPASSRETGPMDAPHRVDAAPPDHRVSDGCVTTPSRFDDLAIPNAPPDHRASDPAPPDRFDTETSAPALTTPGLRPSDGPVGWGASDGPAREADDRWLSRVDKGRAPPDGALAEPVGAVRPSTGQRTTADPRGSTRVRPDSHGLTPEVRPPPGAPRTDTDLGASLQSDRRVARPPEVRAVVGPVSDPAPPDPGELAPPEHRASDGPRTPGRHIDEPAPPDRLGARPPDQQAAAEPRTPDLRASDGPPCASGRPKVPRGMERVAEPPEAPPPRGGRMPTAVGDPERPGDATRTAASRRPPAADVEAHGRDAAPPDPNTSDGHRVAPGVEDHAPPEPGWNAAVDGARPDPRSTDGPRRDAWSAPPDPDASDEPSQVDARPRGPTAAEEETPPPPELRASDGRPSEVGTSPAVGGHGPLPEATASDGLRTRRSGVSHADLATLSRGSPEASEVVGETRLRDPFGGVGDRSQPRVLDPCAPPAATTAAEPRTSDGVRVEDPPPEVRPSDGGREPEPGDRKLGSRRMRGPGKALHDDAVPPEPRASEGYADPAAREPARADRRDPDGPKSAYGGLQQREGPKSTSPPTADARGAPPDDGGRPPPEIDASDGPPVAATLGETERTAPRVRPPDRPREVDGTGHGDGPDEPGPPTDAGLSSTTRWPVADGPPETPDTRGGAPPRRWIPWRAFVETPSRQLHKHGDGSRARDGTRPPVFEGDHAGRGSPPERSSGDTEEGRVHTEPIYPGRTPVPRVSDDAAVATDGARPEGGRDRGGAPRETGSPGPGDGAGARRSAARPGEYTGSGGPPPDGGGFEWTRADGMQVPPEPALTEHISDHTSPRGPCVPTSATQQSMNGAPDDGVRDEERPPDRGVQQIGDMNRAAWKRARGFRATTGGAPKDRADDGSGVRRASALTHPADHDAGGERMSQDSQEPPPGGADDGRRPPPPPPDRSDGGPPVAVLARVVREMHVAARSVARLRALPSWPPDPEHALLQRVAAEMRAAAQSARDVPDTRALISSAGRELAHRVETLLTALGRMPASPPHRGPPRRTPTQAPSRWMDPRPLAPCDERSEGEQFECWSAPNGRPEDSRRRAARGQRRGGGRIDQQPGLTVPGNGRMHRGPPHGFIRQAQGPPDSWVSRLSRGPSCPSERQALGPPFRWPHMGPGPPRGGRLSQGPPRDWTRLTQGPPRQAASLALGGDATWFAHHARPRGDPGGDAASDDGASARSAQT